MDQPALVFDCTELFSNPVETGIQRVVRRLLRHWPGDGPILHPARFVAGHGLVGISDAALAILQETRDGGSGQAVQHMRTRLLEASPVEQPALPGTAPILLPEVFWDRRRAAFYQEMLGRRDRAVAMLAYDFLAFLEPWFFDIRSGAHLMDYLRLMTDATDVSFISRKTRRDYVQRVLRHARPVNAGPAFRLGSDGLQAPRQAWDARRDTFVCIGTIERRKNQDVVVRSFQDLWRSGSRARLVLVGRHFGPSVPTWLAEVIGHPNFEWLEAASDERVAETLRSARATIYAAESEGFGLPPVESLHVGVPVIVSAGLPSLEGMSGEGQLRLNRVTADTLSAAVSSLLDDKSAELLWAGAARLQMTTWETFAAEVAAWCTSLPSRRSPSSGPGEAAKPKLARRPRDVEGGARRKR